MKKISVAAVLLASLALAGCDDKPSDKVTSEVIRKIADNDSTEGLEVTNFERTNGQVDPNSANLYKVTYSYNLKLTKPYAETVLANAKLYQKDKAANAKRETGAFFDATALQNGVDNMQQSMLVNQWVTDQGDGFKVRRDALLNPCAPCIAWWNSEEAPAEAKDRRMAFITAWIAMEQYGFKDSAKIGDTVPRQAWAYFSKTEKGWQAAN
ncbi:hypothetical protein [Burkholderia ubonensis]|uniref:hypothetical protein n=1 Tax=Burkholderia ubonensis TaxID=101571 RepID=UPI00075EA60B|nr:hypothetical protein [Burkholderia ubonensis]KVW86364.1 hypothetical protein WK99_18325 [Burkholderia ubonensis]